MTGKLLLLLAALVGQSPFLVPPPISPRPGLVMSGATQTCANDQVLVDNNGVVGCYWLTNSDPDDLRIRPQANYADGAQTPGDLQLAGGIDEHEFTIANFANCANDTMTITIDGTDYTCVEGTHWTASGSNGATATSLAACMAERATGLASGTASSAKVLVRPSELAMSLTIASSDATCATVANGTPGSVNLWTPVAAKSSMTVTGTLTSNGLTVFDGAVDGVRFMPGWTTIYAVNVTPDTISGGVAWTYANATELSFTVAAGTYYDFYCYGMYTQAVATEGVAISMDCPAVTTYVYTSYVSATSNTETVQQCAADDCPSSGVSNTTFAPGTRFRILGNVTPSGNGTCVMRFAHENTGGSSASAITAGARCVSAS